MAVYQSLTLSQISQNIQDNTSQVRILWESTQTGASHNDYSRTAYYDVYINGGQVTQYSVSYTLPQGTTKTIVDTTITVPHRNDGTGTITVNTWMDTRISAGVVKKSQTLTLSTIPRATTPVIAPLVMGQEGTITLYPASNDFTHTIIITSEYATTARLRLKPQSGRLSGHLLNHLQICLPARNQVRCISDA